MEESRKAGSSVDENKKQENRKDENRGFPDRTGKDIDSGTILSEEPAFQEIDMTGLNLVNPLKDHQSRLVEMTEEMADDMLHLLESIKGLESGMKQMQMQIDQLIQSNREDFRRQNMGLEQMRKVLLSDRKTFITRSAFNAIYPALVSLSLTRNLLKTNDNKLAYDQITVVIEMLQIIIQSLGFQPFTVEGGDAFDPSKMECLDQEPGVPGEVLRVVRAGYRSGEVIIMPCGVILGKALESH